MLPTVPSARETRLPRRGRQPWLWFHRPDDGTPDLFVHHSAIKAGGFRGLQENQRVEFTSGQGVKGPQAEEIHMI